MSTLKSECTNFQEMCDSVAEAHKIIIALDYLDGFTCDMLREARASGVSGWYQVT